ncbi:MAG: UvrD-helicase domain-containing protein, partial [Bacteroidota bacterium]
MQRNLLVYKSSAGSGKTTQIVKEYLSLVIPEPHKYREILAITFTNKAAAEMKSRIVEVLQELAEYKSKSSKLQKELNDKFLIDILEGSNMSIDDVSGNAYQVMKNILHDYSNFAVSTIDSLMHRIIRAFAFDLNLSQRFEVVLDQEELIQKSVDMLLDELQPQHRMTGFLTEFIKAQTDESRSWHIDRSLYSFGFVLQSENALDYIPELRELDLSDFIKTREAIMQFMVKFENVIQKQAKEARDLTDQIPPEAFYQGKRGVWSYFRKLINKENYQNSAIFRGNSYVEKFFNEGKFFSSKATQADKDEIGKVFHQLEDIYNSIKDYAAKDAGKYFFYKVLLRNIHGMAVLKEIETRLDQLKTEQDYVHISEFNRRIAREIQANAPVPFIYERIGEKYKHVFVDEFQDTSVLQWHNLLPLILNGLSYGEKNMLVGDGKQSIYRWRAGEVEQFARLPELFEKQKLPEGENFEATLKQQYQERPLNENYRTVDTIVKFNNDLFRYIKTNTNDRIRKIYDNHEQTAHKKEHGKVQLQFVEGQGEDLEAGHLEALLSSVKESLHAGYECRDIAVLCRTNKHGVKVARYLTEHDFPVVSSESLLLSGSPKLHFLVAVFKLLNNPQDNVAWLEVMHFLHQKRQTDMDFHSFANLPEHNWLNKASGPDSSAYHKFLELLQLGDSQWEDFSLYELSEHLIRTFQLHDPADPFVLFFLEEIHGKALEGDTDLNDFLAWWEKNKNKKSIVAPEKLNAVKIYTVHKAKGLEFPVVMAPFLSKNAIQSKQDSMWLGPLDDFPETGSLSVAYLPARKQILDTPFFAEYQEEQEKLLLDEVNVLYVAFTRPSERLYAFCDMPSKNPAGFSVSSLLGGFVAEQGYDISSDEPILFGEVQKAVEEDKTKETQACGDSESGNSAPMISSTWRNKVVIAPYSGEFPVGEHSLNEKNRGRMLHEMLALVITKKDIPKALSWLQNHGVENPEIIAETGQLLNKVVTHPELQS